MKDELKGGASVGSAPAPRRGGLQIYVLGELRRGLMSGALIPGQVISIRKIAEAVGTSPMPVRDALAQLLAANVLEELPNGSVRVPILSDRRLAELFGARRALERMVAREAVNHVSDDLLKELDSANEDLAASIKKRAFQKSLEANYRFHFALYRASRSEVMMPLIESLWLQAGPTLYSSLIMPDAPWKGGAHKRLMAALRAGDADVVVDAIDHDIKSVADHLLSDESRAERASRALGGLVAKLAG